MCSKEDVDLRMPENTNLSILTQKTQAINIYI